MQLVQHFMMRAREELQEDELRQLVEQLPPDKRYPVGWMLPRATHPRMERLLWCGVEARRVKGSAARRHKRKGG